MPKFLVDENLSPHIAKFLRSKDYNAQAVREVGLTGASDQEIIAWAKINNAVIVTRDIGFGAVHALSDPTFGLILLRSKDDTTEAFQRILEELHRRRFLKISEKEIVFLVATARSVRRIKRSISRR